jgi:hypothetical protein
MNSIRIFQVALTLFYGQFLSYSIFNSITQTIPDLVENPKSFHLAFRGIFFI